LAGVLLFESGCKDIGRDASDEDVEPELVVVIFPPMFNHDSCFG